MKFTTSNSAVHQLCAIWLNGVTLGQNPSMEPVELRVPHLNKYKCDLCGIAYGAVLRCAYVSFETSSLMIGCFSA